MGRYSVPLAPLFADFAGAGGGEQRVLDVGCGPGALTEELVRRLGPVAVAGVDPSEPFVEAVRKRYPGVSVEHAPAEDLPFEDDTFDAALAQLVVHFMTDPVAGIREMARVTRQDGLVAACVWDLARGGQSPLSVFWAAARELDPDLADESQLAGARQGQLAELFEAAGVDEITDAALEVHVEHATFEDWWEPYTLGVGPAGSHVARLGPEGQVQLRERCRKHLPAAPFVLTARAWAARGLVR
jgi:ubiquinone/menaquinone biosynthesis C-methylase UbiE